MKIGDMLGEIEVSELVTDAQSDAAINMRELRRSYDRATKIPATLVSSA